MQANECNPLQFIAHDPHIPYLHDLLNANVESKFYLTYINASRYIGGIFLRSI